MPQSAGADADTTITSYYTADGTGPAECQKPEWAGLLCTTGPKAQPTSGKPLPVTKAESYSYYGLATVATEAAGSVVRTVTTRYDDAGRTIGVLTTVSPESEGGTPTPETVTTYDPATGLVTTVTAGNASTTTQYDTFGRAISYTDADGNTSTATCTVDGKVATSTDGKGTSTYTYDGTDAAGRQERRGFLTKLEVSGVGGFGGAYDTDGQLSTRTYPNGLAATTSYDSAGNDTALSYSKGGTRWLEFTNTPGINGTISAASSPGGRQEYGYDTAGRLTKVADTYNGKCVTRAYAFTANHHHLHLRRGRPPHHDRLHLRRLRPHHHGPEGPRQRRR